MERANVRSTRHATGATLLPFVNADGAVIISVYILKGRFGEDGSATVNFSLERAPAITRRMWPRSYCWADTIYLDADTFKGILAYFAEE